MPQGSAADVDRAVEAAEAAHPAWAAMEPKARAGLMKKLAAKLRERADEILRVEVVDTGNTISKMRADVATAGDTLDYYSGLHTEIKGETIPASAKNLHITIREPYGTVGRIIPFNHPIKFAANALAAPLMAGNCVVLKPPETSPLSATMLGEICREVLPAGVVNIVTGTGLPTGDAIARHPKVKRIAFTGSVPTGRAIQRAAAEGGVKHVTLELGGKNPLIAFPDMDPDKVAQIAVAGMNFAWQGQSCGSTSRLLLHESLYKPVLERVVDRVGSLKLGDPLDDKSQMGPINSRRHYERVISMVQSGVSDGAKLMTGGKRPSGFRFFPRLLARADGIRQRQSRHAHRQGGNLRAGALGVHLEGRSRGARACQRHRVRPDRLDLHKRYQDCVSSRARGKVRLRLDQWRVRPFLRHAVRRLQKFGARPRGGDR